MKLLKDKYALEKDLSDLRRVRSSIWEYQLSFLSLALPLGMLGTGFTSLYSFFFFYFFCFQAVDDKQNEVISSALDELMQRKDTLEQNVKLAHDLKVDI